MSKYLKITIESLWITLSDEKFVPLLPTGCSFIDVLAAEIRRRGHASARFYAQYMKVDYRHFCNTLETLTGSTPAQWIDRLVMLVHERWLLNTVLTVAEIATRRGSASGGDSACPWILRYRLPPHEYLRNILRFVTLVFPPV